MFRSWATFRSRDSFRACALRRNTYHSIRLDELNKNPSTAHRLVEICSRYRSFLLRMRSCPIRPQSFRSWHIQVQKVETNRMRCVSSLGDASFPRYLRFTSAHARQLRIANLRMRRRKRRYLWNEASPRDETHLVRFVSTSCALIRELQKDWARIGQLRMRSSKTTISRRDLNQSMRR